MSAMADHVQGRAYLIFTSCLSRRLWAAMLIASSAFSRGSAFRPTLHRFPNKLPNQKDVFKLESPPAGARRVDLASYAPSPHDSENFFKKDWAQFDNDYFPVHETFPLEGDGATLRMLQRQRNSRHERAERRARASVRLAGRNMRSSPDVLRLVASAMSDFATSLGVGLLNAATPLSLDPIAADSIRVAIYSAFNNATTDVLENTQPYCVAESNCKHVSNLILRNAIAPAILHRMVGVIVDNLISDAELAEKSAVNDFTMLSSESYEAATHLAHLVAVAFDLH